MAEKFAGRGHALVNTRAALKKYYATGHPLYPFFAQRAYDVARWEDEFTGPTIDSNKYTLGNGGGASAASPAIAAGVENGVAAFVTGTANDNTASSILSTGRHFLGQNNPTVVARLTILSAVTNTKIEMGFKDNITTTAGSAQVVNSKSGNTFIATDGVCWIYDTAHNSEWGGRGVANTVAATVMTPSAAITPTAGTYEYVGLSLEGTTAYFWHLDQHGNQNFAETAMSGAVTTDVLLAAYIYVEARSATSKTVRVDWLGAYQGRTTA